MFSSSVAEVLPAFLLQERYQAVLLEDKQSRWALVRNILDMVAEYARLETELLLKWREQDPSWPLFELSRLASEHIFSFQHSLFQRLPEILANEGLVERVLSLYVPMILQEKLGLPFIRATLGTAELSVYRDAIITKKLASMAFYRYGLQWQSYLEEVEKEPIAALLKAVE